MIEVNNKIQARSSNGGVRLTGAMEVGGTDCQGIIKISINEASIYVLASDLEAAIKNAANINRWDR